jgi:hypothetical protein
MLLTAWRVSQVVCIHLSQVSSWRSIVGCWHQRTNLPTVVLFLFRQEAKLFSTIHDKISSSSYRKAHTSIVLLVSL